MAHFSSFLGKPKSPVASVPCAWTVNPGNELGINGGGLRNFQRIDKVYPTNYALVAMCLSVAVWHSKRQFLALYDMPQGAVIQAKLAFDLLSWPGRLAFGLFDEGGSSTRLIATSVVNGQLYDWGKGKRALGQIFGETERLLWTLTATR